MLLAMIYIFLHTDPTEFLVNLFPFFHLLSLFKGIIFLMCFIIGYFVWFGYTYFITNHVELLLP